MLDEKIEFELSQYLDGTLSSDERAAIELRLASDSEARAVLNQFRRLDESLRATPPAIPNLNWDLISDQISNSIDRHERESLLTPAARAPSRWRDSVRHLALAAALAIASGVAVFVYYHSNQSNAGGGQGESVTVAVAEGPKVEVAPGPSSTVVGSVGPASPAAVDDARIAESIVTRPSRVVWIASGADVVQDREPVPF